MCCICPVTEDNVFSSFQLTNRKCSAIEPPGHLHHCLRGLGSSEDGAFVPCGTTFLLFTQKLFKHGWNFFTGRYFNPPFEFVLPQCGFVVGSLNYVDRLMPL